jgi:predicted ribosomally synthesized peptide with nif11-like leader
MSEEQLSALIAKLQDDAGLQEKLKGAADLDAALAIAKEAGFDVSKADWLRHQAQQTLELSNEELESVAGGNVLERGGNKTLPLTVCNGQTIWGRVQHCCLGS